MLIKLHNLINIIDGNEFIIINEMLIDRHDKIYEGYCSEFDYQTYREMLDYYVYDIETNSNDMIQSQSAIIINIINM